MYVCRMKVGIVKPVDQPSGVEGWSKCKSRCEGLEQPVATGIATVNNATISAQALPELLTDVTGTVQFNRDRIQVEGVQGKFSRGNVQARGNSIFARPEPDDPDRANPLTVTPDQLELNHPTRGERQRGDYRVGA